MDTSKGAAGEPRQHAITRAGHMARRPFMELLRARWETAGTLLCVGLDPELERLPEAILAGDTASGTEASETEDGAERIERALLAFSAAIVDATADLVCAFKPNAAFYEAHGPAGLRALLRTIAYIHGRYPEIPVILDAKRGDIGSTSAAYARAVFDVAGADAVTFSPYLGRDALAPFLERADRGCLILCRTSNPGAAELQDLLVAARSGPEHAPLPLYQVVARCVAEQWNQHGNCSLVVGATYPGELRAVREIAGDLPILVPGIGAQGGDLEATLDAGLDSLGHGLMLSASRSVLYASAGPDFAQAARAEALRLHAAIKEYRERHNVGLTEAKDAIDAVEREM